MNDRKGPSSQQELKKLRQEIFLSPEKQLQLLSDKKALMDRIEAFNTKAVFCIEGQQWQHALIFLQQTERLLECATEKDQLVDQGIVQCVLHNEACCYQNLWQLQQCSNYIEALIFNLNNRKKQKNLKKGSQLKEDTYSKYGLAKYYLQFSAVNSQISNHSGALISARKAHNILRKELNLWEKFLESKQKIKSKTEHQQKTILLDLICNFNDNPNPQMIQTLIEATSYFLKLYYINLQGTKSCSKDLRHLIQTFTMKSIMQIQSITYPEYLNIFEKQCDLSLYALFERVLLLSACYFTMATELRLIGMNKSEENTNNYPEYKESESYHLLAILILTLAISVPCQFLNHLLQTYEDHYGNSLTRMDVPFKKIFTEIIIRSEHKKYRDTSIQYSDQEEGLLSHLSKGSGTLNRFTKYSDKDKKMSWLDPKKTEKKSQKKSKEKSKRKQSTSKPKKQSSSLSKSPYSKTPKQKDSYLIKSPRSPKSKESIHLKSPLNSLKHISNPIRQKLVKPSHQKTDKIHSKSKKKKMESRINDYFLQRQGQKKTKKTSVSSKKNSSQPRSTGRLPINSTLQTKDPGIKQKKKKPSKKSLLQHYL